MRTALAVAGVAVAASSVVAAVHARPASRIVPCTEIIDAVPRGDGSGRRVVLGVVSVPRTYLPQVVETRSSPWRGWSKAGLMIRGGRGSLIGVSVPRAWRRRAAITWGYRSTTGIVSSLRIARCRAVAGFPWNGYSGGFYLRGRSACVPLLFRVGTRSAVVRFGVGRRC